MKHIFLKGINALLLFSMLFSMMSIQHGSEMKEISGGQSVVLTQTEMSNIVGGDLLLTIGAGSDVFYWIAAGAAVGFIFAGSGGILAGAFYGGLIGALFG